MKMTKSKNLWQLIFIMCILYAVSSVNVLVIFRSILPYLPPGFYLETMILKYFALVSFGIAVFLSSYHFFITFNKVEKDNLSDRATRWINRISKFLHFFIAIYVLSSIYVLLWGVFGVAPSLPIGEGSMWILYSIFSFLVVIFVAAFYFSVYFLMRKKIDK